MAATEFPVSSDHHYVPQFFLRSFAVAPDRRKINTVAKHGDYAVWAERSIKSIGYDRDLYVHVEHGVPVSVESGINRGIETPISQSATWQKITSDRADSIDRSDKKILYSLIQHLSSRNPHALATRKKLARLASSTENEIPFLDEEREMYLAWEASENVAMRSFNLMSSTLRWTERGFRGAGLSIMRSPIPLRSSTCPVISIPAPAHPALKLPLPGMVPYQLVLTLNRTTIASLVLGDFDDAFINVPIDVDVAKQFNRYFLGHFAYFEHVRHLISDRSDLVVDMTWGPYSLTEEKKRKISFRRQLPSLEGPCVGSVGETP